MPAHAPAPKQATIAPPPGGGQAAAAAPVSDAAVARLFRRAAALHQRGHDADACDLYHAVLRHRPGHAAAWANLGALLRKTDRPRAAVACYNRALRLTPGDPGFLSNLGNALKDMGRVRDALRVHAAVVAKSPDDASFRFNYAVALKQAGRFDDALHQMRAACKTAPDNPRYAFDRALLHLHLGEYVAGWRGYEARIALGETKLPHPAPQWRGEPLAGETVLVTLEQGFGDAIFAARFLPLLQRRGARVILQCKPATRRLFARLLGVDGVCGPEDTPAADYQCPIMSLPGLFAATPATTPPLPRLHIPAPSQAKADAVFAATSETAAPALRVGVVWSGSTTFKGNAQRAAAFDRFLALANIPDVQLYSLQKGPPAADLRDAGLGPMITDLAPVLDDFADTAAMLRRLHVVVMTDSAVAHLAGSLSVPVWNLLDTVPYWLYGAAGDTTAWYPSMRLFRQTTAGDWPGVFSRVAAELGQWARSL